VIEFVEFAGGVDSCLHPGNVITIAAKMMSESSLFFTIYPHVI
jgi:hypothetical protein